MVESTWKQMKGLEVSKEDYLEGLTRKERIRVQGLVPTLVGILDNRGIHHPVVIAVGSSAFPEWYWTNVKRLRELHPDANLPETYRDINLRVLQNEVPLPIDPVDEKIGISTIASDLTKRGYNTSSRSTYMDSEDRGLIIEETISTSPFGRVSKVNRSWFNTFFESIEVYSPEQGEKTIEVIFRMSEMDPPRNMDPSDRIYNERKMGRAFSILYGSEACF